MCLDDFINIFPKAILALANGAIFEGWSIGASGEAVGEVVFNTAMSGYQEILTDPSYCQQIVTLTYPMIGNVGINADDAESSAVWAKGLIIRELSLIASNWRAQHTLSDYLKANKIVAIAGVDTRRLTRLLRDDGAQSGCILVGDEAESALMKAKQFAGLAGADLAQTVSADQPDEWKTGLIELAATVPLKQAPSLHVVVYDFGVKQNILRLLKARGCKVTVVPAKTSVEKIMALKPHGVLLSNGPGDPAACDYAIANTQQLLEKKIPVFGICLGFQILALACGAKTVKMKFGHHGANHPVQDVHHQRVYITSQNHGFMVDQKSLPTDLIVTHQSLFDGSLQGIRHKTKPALAFQGHPEASPGPQDIHILFDEFIDMMLGKKSHA